MENTYKYNSNSTSEHAGASRHRIFKTSFLRTINLSKNMISLGHEQFYALIQVEFSK